MKRFEKVQQILDRAVAGARRVGPHGPFWRGKTVEEFVAYAVFGSIPVVTPGDPEQSKLIQALEGRAPFGIDIGTAGAIYRRMPAELPPVPADDINFIREWIADGCPDDEEQEVDPAEASRLRRRTSSEMAAVDPDVHVSFWRAFDDWAMFQVTPEVQNAIFAHLFPSVRLWHAAARDAARRPQWERAVAAPATRDAIDMLSARQLKTAADHYGQPLRIDELYACMELFGRDQLPDDALPPADPRHRMNGVEMWFFWGAFVDACLLLDVSRPAWGMVGQCVLGGLLCDGAFRGRFNVTGFAATEAGAAAIRAHALGVRLEDLPREFARRYVESGLG